MAVAKKKEIQTVEIIVGDSPSNFSVVDTQYYAGEIVLLYYVPVREAIL